jgi:hypothetical protein
MTGVDTSTLIELDLKLNITYLCLKKGLKYFQNVISIKA